VGDVGDVIVGVTAVAAAIGALVLVVELSRVRRAHARTPSFDSMLTRQIALTHGPPVLDEVLRRGLTTPADTQRDVSDRLVHQVDPARFRPKIADGVEVRIFRLRWGNDYAMIADPGALIHYRLEVREAELLALMDGTRTVAEIVVDRLEASGDLDASGVTALVELLRSKGFLDPRPVDVERAIERSLDPASALRMQLRRFARTLSIEWMGADAFFRTWYRLGGRAFFTPIGVIGVAVVGVGGLAAFVDLQQRDVFRLNAQAAPAESLLLLGLGLTLTFAHELGHAEVLVHHGRRIRSAGFKISYASPAFYVESSDVLMLDRGARILQSFAGPFAELAVAGVASIVTFAFPDWEVSRLLYRFALLNYFIIFLNLVPMLELDGYWILADAIQVPDLRPRSIAFIRHDLWHKLRGRVRLTPQELGLGAFALGGIAFTIVSLFSAYAFWRLSFGSLVSSLWRGGILTRALLLLLVFCLAGPAIRGATSLAKAAFVRGRALARRIRSRLETSWRSEAAELIDALPTFVDLPREILDDLASRVKVRTLGNGQPVFRQGDRATAFYVVRRGSIDIETEHPETHDIQVLATLGRGGSFGELGLVGAAPRRATARALGDTELFAIDKGSFDRLLADAIEVPDFGHTLQSLAELKEMVAFSHLEIDDLSELLHHGAWVTASPGTPIIREGEPGDAFYSIHRGQVDVLAGGRMIGEVGPGGFFGEVALLHDAPRNATVVARTPLRAFRLSREGFDRTIADAFGRGMLKPPTSRAPQH
jgi:CRP-like cAMP-binding protein/Zn-dependent protease